IQRREIVIYRAFFCHGRRQRCGPFCCRSRFTRRWTSHRVRRNQRLACEDGVKEKHHTCLHTLVLGHVVSIRATIGRRHRQCGDVCSCGSHVQPSSPDEATLEKAPRLNALATTPVPSMKASRPSAPAAKGLLLWPCAARSASVW